MTHVLLDANAIGVDPPLGKIEHRVMLDAHRSGAIVLVIPELALREAVAGWRRILTSHLGKLHNVKQQLSKLAPSHAWHAPRLNLDQSTDDLLAELSKALEVAQVEMPKTPDADHEDLIDRALNRRQPFDESGSGYRDALLWEIARELANEGSHLLLVSNDPKAFAEDRKKRANLASTLSEEITGEGSVSLVSNMREAIEGLGLVAPEALDATKTVIKRIGPSFGKQLLDRITMDLMHPVHSWVTRKLVNPFVASSASLGVPHELLRLDVEEARTVEDGTLEASLFLKVRQWVTIYLPTHATKQFEAVGMVFPVDDNFDGLEIDGVVEHRCRVVLDPMTDRILSAEPLEAVAAHPAS